jgi:DNA-binding XRE family transcriptional regulator
MLWLRRHKPFENRIVLVPSYGLELAQSGRVRERDEKMDGLTMKAWRERHGYGHHELMNELGVKSRQTLYKWEKSNEIPRLVELALIALEAKPENKRVLGKKATPKEAREYFQGAE